MLENEREVTLNKIQAKIALSLAKGPESAKDTLAQWNRYVHLTYGIEDTTINEELDMQAAYAEYKTLTPKLVREKGGKIKVHGLSRLK